MLMKNLKILRKAALGGSVLGSIGTSLCCAGPLAAVALGATGVAASGALEKWRPVFLGLTFLLLAPAWYLIYWRPKAGCAEGAACVTGPASKWSKASLWGATALLAVAAAAPRLSSSSSNGKKGGACCALGNLFGGQAGPVPEATTSTPGNIPWQRVSLYAVPLVCPVAPQIGCGSHAKPILLALERQPGVAQAWLNHSGTRLAVVWKPDATPAKRAFALDFIRTREGLDMRELSGSQRQATLQGFRSGRGWLRGAAVDGLSREEAGVMAARLVRRIQARVSLSAAKAQALQGELQTLFIHRLIGPHSDNEPPAATEVLRVLQRRLNEKEIALLKETLPRNLRPQPGER
jgi:MerT mercuric transport protein